MRAALVPVETCILSKFSALRGRPPRSSRAGEAFRNIARVTIWAVVQAPGDRIPCPPGPVYEVIIFAVFLVVQFGVWVAMGEVSRTVIWRQDCPFLDCDGLDNDGWGQRAGEQGNRLEFGCLGCFVADFLGGF